MHCDVCGTEVEAHHKFCMECGARLATTPAVADAGQPGPRAAPPSGRGNPMFDPATGQLLAVPSSTGGRAADQAGNQAGAGEPTTGALDDEDATSVLPALGPPVTTFAPPDPTPGRGLPWSAVLDPPTPLSSPTTSAAPVTPPPPPVTGVDRSFGGDAYPAWPGEPVASGSLEDGRYYEPTRAQYVAEPYVAPPPRPAAQPYAPTSHVPVAYAPWSGEAETEPVARPRRQFRVRPLLILSVFAVVAAATGMVAAIVDIDAPGSSVGGQPWKINDFGTNLTVAGIVTALTMLIGALAWCAGYRWGAGLAGGAGAGLAGWAILPIGAAEATLSTARLDGPAEMTWEVGWWALVAAGGLGLLVLVVSLARAGNDRRAGLDPWVAAVGAASAITAAIGPLIPLNDAGLEQNWSSPAGVDIPTLYFVARFVNLGLLMMCGVVGFLLVRRYGLGMVFGGSVGVGWLVLTGAMARTDKPIGPAYYNPGAVPGGIPPWTMRPEQLAPLDATGDLKPHIVTIVGIALVGFFALVATAMALIDSD